MILDIHTHLPPAAQWPLFLEHCRDCGITLAVVSSLGSWARYPDADDIRRANDEARCMAETAQGMVLWFAYINPQNDNALTELDRALADGACGVKLWVSLKDPATGSLARVLPILAEAERRRVPVLIHTYQRTDANLEGEVTVAEFADLARQFPTLTMIAAHSGGNWRQCLGLLRDLPNTVVDICGGYPETGMVEALVADLGVERVLYGSDALGRSFVSQVAKVTLSSLSEADQERILWENSARLLKLTPGQVSAAQMTAAGLPATPRLALPAFAEDHFCFAGSWPFRSSAAPTPADLDCALAAVGIARAYVADAASVYALDVLAANRAFLDAASGRPRLAPLALMVPYAPNWRAVLEESRGRAVGGVVYPYLHNWRLDEPRWRPFFEACAAAGFPLWINTAISDGRFRHRGVVWRDVSTDELIAWMQAAPANDYVVQGAGFGQIKAALERCPQARRVRFEISKLTDTSTVLPALVRQHGWDRLVLGSEFPFRDLRQVRQAAGVLCGAVA